jgi:hypothetical protein
MSAGSWDDPLRLPDSDEEQPASESIMASPPSQFPEGLSVTRSQVMDRILGDSDTEEEEWEEEEEKVQYGPKNHPSDFEPDTSDEEEEEEDEEEKKQEIKEEQIKEEGIKKEQIIKKEIKKETKEMPQEQEEEEEEEMPQEQEEQGQGIPYEPSEMDLIEEPHLRVLYRCRKKKDMGKYRELSSDPISENSSSGEDEVAKEETVNQLSASQSLKPWQPLGESQLHDLLHNPDGSQMMPGDVPDESLGSLTESLENEMVHLAPRPCLSRSWPYPQEVYDLESEEPEDSFSLGFGPVPDGQVPLPESQSECGVENEPGLSGMDTIPETAGLPTTFEVCPIRLRREELVRMGYTDETFEYYVNFKIEYPASHYMNMKFDPPPPTPRVPWDEEAFQKDMDTQRRWQETGIRKALQERRKRQWEENKRMAMWPPPAGPCLASVPGLEPPAPQAPPQEPASSLKKRKRVTEVPATAAQKWIKRSRDDELFPSGFWDTAGW